ncbi:LysE family translocator [Roseomonas sp. CCTCC AB2023176]|uniref:LysE family translocator n=1 Tax=Roseomonas sp. CCTCC AB2023176 TaxID=3342640 RepID=UPI0035E32298
MTDPAVFVLTVLFILGTPGPTNTLLATGGASMGVRRSLPLMVGEACGYSISILTIGLVLAPVISGVPWAALALRLVVGAYLVLLAVQLWQRGASFTQGARTVTPAQVFVTTLLNPKAIVFALGVVPFGAANWPAYFAGFLAMLATVAFAWIALGAALGQAAAATGRARLVPRVGAAAVMGFAAFLLVGPLVH